MRTANCPVPIRRKDRPRADVSLAGDVTLCQGELAISMSKRISKVTYVVAHVDGSVMTARDFATREEAEWARQEVLALPEEYLRLSPEQLIVRKTVARDRSQFRKPACQTCIDAIAKRMRSSPCSSRLPVIRIGFTIEG